MQFRCWHVSSPFCEVIERRACETLQKLLTTLRNNCSRHVGCRLGDVSWQPFMFLESPWGGAGQFLLDESQSRIHPNMCAKFCCGPTVVSKGGTDRHTKGHCSFIVDALSIADYCTPGCCTFLLCYHTSCLRHMIYYIL